MEQHSFASLRLQVEILAALVRDKSFALSQAPGVQQLLSVHGLLNPHL